MLLQQLTDHTPQSMGPSSLEQEDRGAPCTPVDEGALFATPSTSMRLSEVSDLHRNQLIRCLMAPNMCGLYGMI
jgi:hypothetical protein